MRNMEFTPNIIDRIMSAVSYITAGWGGLIYMVILYFARKNSSRFLRFNVFQSIFISFSVFVIGMIYRFLFEIFTNIPILQILMSWIDLILNKPTFGPYSITQAVIVIYLSYVVILSLMGRFPLIYKISNLISRM